MSEPADGPTCFRCGAFVEGGPAAALGFLICAACYAWTPATQPWRLRQGVLAAAGILPSIAVAVAVITTLELVPDPAFFVPDSVDLDAVGEAVAGIIVLPSLLVLLAFFVWVVMVPRRLLRVFSITRADLPRLLPGAAVNGAIGIAGIVESPSGGLRIFAPREIGFAMTSARGIVVLGARTRAAIPWEEADVLETRWPRSSLRIARPSRGDFLVLHVTSKVRKLLLAYRPSRAAPVGAP